MTILAVLVASAAIAALLARSVARFPGGLRSPNFRGAELPASLGVVVALAAAIAIALVGAVRLASARGWMVGARMWAVLAGGALVFGAGLADDRWGGGPRGIREHLARSRRGRPTTGLGKLAAAVAAGVLGSLAVPGRPAGDVAVATFAIAGCANLWNGLDVRPGRCLKAFIPAGLALLAFGPFRDAGVPLAGLAGAGIGVLWPDLREQAMLGDSGSNLAGYGVGVGLAALLSGWGLAGAAAAVVALNVAAETVTLTRLIEAIPALRWADRLARAAEPEASEPSPAGRRARSGKDSGKDSGPTG